ncbi:MAG: KUP/HAK/KT family potassium transporter [bacterium]
MYNKEDIGNIVKSMGLVFGDIGTSPIYTFTVIFLLIHPNLQNVMGILSLIFWTFMILVTLEYAVLAMSLSKKGEGGTVVLREILVPLLKDRKSILFITILSYVGVSLLMGDGVITPAISILSAVEGMRLIPGWATVPQTWLIATAAIIAIGLFSIQRKGTEKVANAFGPLMVIWFTTLSVSGLYYIAKAPYILKAINPYYAIQFFMHNGLEGFIILSAVILCATGGEALYADMGHLGRVPVSRAWYIVFFALVLNYFGQGAFLMINPHAKNILFEMLFSESKFLYVPFLVLSIIATVIASQAMISGMFSVVYQGITTRIMPLFKVDYTSPELRAQIYIGFVNWFLLAFVLIVMFIFKESNNLAAAYGLAVTGTMTITGIMMIWIFKIKKQPIKAFLSVIVLIADLAFLIANMHKIPSGGYWSIIIAAIPMAIILIYTNGQRMLYRALKPIGQENFLNQYEAKYKEAYRIRETALFLIKDPRQIPPYVVSTMFGNGIIYEDNIFVSVNITDHPYGTSYEFKDNLGTGLRYFVINIGYMEVIDVEKILKEAQINEKVIFYGLEEIITDNIIWKIFSFIKKNTPAFVQFYALPSNKLHGVITRVEI